MTVIDGAQGVAHCEVDVKALGADFYAFSGHKLYAASGTGVLWGRKELLDRMPPYMGGGEMISSVKWSGSSFAPVPQKFEAGTQNMAGVPTLVPAFRWAEKFREYPELDGIKHYLLETLPQIEGLRLWKPIKIKIKYPFSPCCKGRSSRGFGLDFG